MTSHSISRVLAPMALAITMIASLGCSKKPAIASTSPFPESNRVPGWTRSAEIRTFPAAELWKYIDGDAEKYLKAGVASTSTSDYKFQDKFDVVVDIYTMADAAGAKTIFESEPTASATTPQIGDAARLYEQSLVFRQGRFLVRIIAYQSSANLSQGLLDLGKRIDEGLIK
jgi:Family of unknown function (DUF6599)